MVRNRAEVSLLDTIRSFYIGSGDFNGLPLRPGESEPSIAEAVELTKLGLVQVVTSEDYINPHIRPWQSLRSIDNQIESTAFAVAINGVAVTSTVAPEFKASFVPGSENSRRT